MLGAAILVGGASRRMGSDKSALVWNGRTAVDRVFDLAAATGAEMAIAVGREVPGREWLVDDRAGPVGAVLAAARRLRELGGDRMLVLAVDAPTLSLVDLEPLLRPASGAAYLGQPLPMVVPLAALPADAEPGWPMARLAEQAGLARPPCPDEALARVRGANTPEERAALLDELVRRESACGRGAD